MRSAKQIEDAGGEAAWKAVSRRGRCAAQRRADHPGAWGFGIGHRAPAARPLACGGRAFPGPRRERGAWYFEVSRRQSLGDVARLAAGPGAAWPIGGAGTTVDAMDQSRTPYLDALVELADTDPGRFHIPGHK